MAFDAAGNLYVANVAQRTVSKVTPAGVISTFAAGFDDPEGLAFDCGRRTSTSPTTATTR